MLFFAPLTVFSLFLGGMCAIGSKEMLKACSVPEKKGYFLATQGAAVAMAVGMGLWKLDLTVFSVTLSLTAVLFMLAIKQFTVPEQSIPYEKLLVCLFAGIVFPMFFSSLLLLRQLPEGAFMVLLPVVTSFSADSGAYFVGVLLGKHRGVTQVSPNKSLEGYIGGLIFAPLFMAFYGYLLNHNLQLEELTVNITMFAMYGFVGGFMTALGDLTFSLIKRHTGIKDYGTLIAGHGGILDRFDGMCLSAPTIWILLQIFPPF